MSKKTVKINVPIMTRVEGEGALELTIDNQQITTLQLRIYEPPRYFEKFLEGRNYYDVPDTVARICGICPVAYQMSASHAIESIFDIKVTPWIRDMRRLFYCGEWLQSHSLHIHLLAAPDYFGFNSVIEMSVDYADEVRRGLKLQALGNDLISLLGARSVHPVGAKIGGFSKAPDKNKIKVLLERVVDAKQDAIDLIQWLDTLDLPADNQDFTSVALRHEHEYPLNEGRIISDNGLDIAISEFTHHFKEMQVDYSTALHCLLNGQPYLVGPLARLNLNKDQLPQEIQLLMNSLKTRFPSKNMFHSIIARAIEIYFSLLEVEKILANYKTTDQPCMNFEVKAGSGYGCTEAPRGILWHYYEMDDTGCVIKSTIVPPTSQNQARIEQDLKDSLITFGLDKTKEQLKLHAEKVIRNYDPCISCATHFLNLNLIRDTETEFEFEFEKTNKIEISFKNIDLSRTAIIGIGSPHRGDESGWDMIDRLLENEKMQSLQKKGLTLLKLDRPGLMLIEPLKNYQQVLLIDAIKPAKTNPTFISIDIDHDSHQFNSTSRFLSTHEAGMIRSIELFMSLKLSATKIKIIAVSNASDQTTSEILNMF